MRFIAPGAAALVLSVGTLLSTAATSATADVVTVTDKSSDVVHEVGEEGDSSTILGYTASRATGVDARSLRVNHTNQYVSVRIRIPDFDDELAQATINIRRDGEAEPSASLVVDYAETDGTVTRRATVEADGVTRCRGIDLRTNPGEKGYLYARFDRSCIDDPARIRVSATIAQVDLSTDDVVVDIDYVSPTRYRAPVWTSWVDKG